MLARLLGHAVLLSGHAQLAARAHSGGGEGSRSGEDGEDGQEAEHSEGLRTDAGSSTSTETARSLPGRPLRQ